MIGPLSGPSRFLGGENINLQPFFPQKNSPANNDKILHLGLWVFFIFLVSIYLSFVFIYLSIHVSISIYIENIFPYFVITRDPW